MIQKMIERDGTEALVEGIVLDNERNENGRSVDWRGNHDWGSHVYFLSGSSDIVTLGRNGTMRDDDGGGGDQLNLVDAVGRTQGKAASAAVARKGNDDTSKDDWSVQEALH